MKKNNPHTPILLRDASGTLPKVFARYELGRETSKSLEGKNAPIRPCGLKEAASVSRLTWSRTLRQADRGAGDRPGPERGKMNKRGGQAEREMKARKPTIKQSAHDTHTHTRTHAHTLDSK